MSDADILEVLWRSRWGGAPVTYKHSQKLGGCERCKKRIVELKNRARILPFTKIRARAVRDAMRLNTRQMWECLGISSKYFFDLEAGNKMPESRVIGLYNKAIVEHNQAHPKRLITFLLIHRSMQDHVEAL